MNPSPLEIIYFDKDILIINKPSGLLSIRDGYRPELPYAVSVLQASYGRIFPVHRLDKETSGIMLFARSATSHKNLNYQFEQRSIKKIYQALIIGCPPKKVFSVNLPLKIDGDRRHRSTIDPVLGKPARTDFSVIEGFSGLYSWVNAEPHTGYTHQIRSHLAAQGFPILSDPLYSPNNEPFLSLSRSSTGASWINRLALHASQVSFCHPVSNQLLSFTAPLPQDFLSAIAALRLI